MTNNWSINSWVCIKRTPVHQTFISTATWPLTTCLRFTLRPKCWLSRAEDQIHCWGGRHLQCVSASSTEDKKKIWRDWRCFWQAQVRQTLQDNCSGGPFVGSKIQGQPLFHCSRAPRDLVTWSPRVNQNSLSNSVLKWPPWSNQCPETSTEQKTIKNRVAFAKAHSLPKGWTLEKWQKVDFSD